MYHASGDSFFGHKIIRHLSKTRKVRKETLCQTVRTVIITKNGFVRSKQRYRCKTCGYNFVEGDERTNPQTTIKRAFAVILRLQNGTIANVSPSTVQKWLAKEAALLSEPEIPINTRELEFDEMWHFIGSFQSQFLVKQAKPLPGLSVVADTFRRPETLNRFVLHDNWEAFAWHFYVPRQWRSNVITAILFWS